MCTLSYKDTLTSVAVDECASNDGGCGQHCTNTEGSFECACDPEYQLNVDGTMCDGIHHGFCIFPCLKSLYVVDGLSLPTSFS